MRVRLIKRKTLDNFAKENARSRSSIKLWLTTIKMVDWADPGDIAETFGSADLLGNTSDRVVFNLGGNNYRMICKYNFGITKVHLYVKWIGTHAEYTKLCNHNQQFSVNSF